jgi:hypothetical protein
VPWLLIEPSVAMMVRSLPGADHLKITPGSHLQCIVGNHVGRLHHKIFARFDRNAITGNRTTDHLLIVRTCALRAALGFEHATTLAVTVAKTAVQSGEVEDIDVHPNLARRALIVPFARWREKG